MFRQILSRIQHDDNPRLHHTPFFILWVASYGLGWFLIRTYEMPYHEHWVSDFYNWLNKYNYSASRVREDIFLGLIFGLSLAFIQSCVLNRRYGYVPKFWGIATIIGAMLSGFGYIKTGLPTFPLYNRGNILLDFVIWFNLINIAQAIVMFRVSHKAWRIAGVGILASLIASVVALSDWVSPNRADLALMFGIIIQAFGTGIVVLQIMAEPRSGSVPKREREKSKNSLRKGFHPLTFMGLWFTSYAISSLFWQVIMLRLYLRYKYNLGSLDSWLRINGFENLPYIILITCSGFILAVGQQWLMKQQFKPIRHWVLLTTIGWAIAGFVLSDFVTNFRFDRSMSPLWFSLYFLVPIFFQSIAMARATRFGWLWISPVIIIVPTIANLSYINQCYYQRPEYLQIGLLLTSITGLLFLVLCKLQQEQPSLETER